MVAVLSDRLRIGGRILRIFHSGTDCVTRYAAFRFLKVQADPVERRILRFWAAASFYCVTTRSAY